MKADVVEIDQSKVVEKYDGYSFELLYGLARSLVLGMQKLANSWHSLLIANPSPKTKFSKKASCVR